MARICMGRSDFFQASDISGPALKKGGLYTVDPKHAQKKHIPVSLQRPHPINPFFLPNTLDAPISHHSQLPFLLTRASVTDCPITQDKQSSSSKASPSLNQSSCPPHFTLIFPCVLISFTPNLIEPETRSHKAKPVNLTATTDNGCLLQVLKIRTW